MSVYFEPPDDPYRVPFDGSFRVADAPTSPVGEGLKKKQAKEALAEQVEEMGELQRKLYAQDAISLLLVFQAMDAAGKDGTIRAVMSGIDPAGCQVHSFKQPSHEELDHDFLWRTACRLPERGRIGIFNRSYYEEVLVVRVHPEYLGGQRLPWKTELPDLWEQRYRSIRDHELHLASNGTVILKFWLNVSHAEQGRRFLDRIAEPEKNWKFSLGDVKERDHWGAYMEAYEDALNATSRPWAPWYAVPADDKDDLRVAVARIVNATLRALPLAYPAPDPKTLAGLDEARRRLLGS